MRGERKAFLLGSLKYFISLVRVSPLVLFSLKADFTSLAKKQRGERREKKKKKKREER